MAAWPGVSPSSGGSERAAKREARTGRGAHGCARDITGPAGMPAGVRKENGGETLSRRQSQGALWEPAGWVPGREDERSPHLLKERPERSGSPTFMPDHPAYVFKFRFLALVPQDSDSES